MKKLTKPQIRMLLKLHQWGPTSVSPWQPSIIVLERIGHVTHKEGRFSTLYVLTESGKEALKKEGFNL